jgi:hypothetical protein
MFGQTLSSITLSKPRMQNKNGQREYIQHQKIIASKFNLQLEMKKINLGVNSVKYYSSKAGTISFYFYKCRLSFELDFFRL